MFWLTEKNIHSVLQLQNIVLMFNTNSLVTFSSISSNNFVKSAERNRNISGKQCWGLAVFKINKQNTQRLTMNLKMKKPMELMGKIF